MNDEDSNSCKVIFHLRLSNEQDELDSVADLQKICWGCQNCMYYILNGFKLKQIVDIRSSDWFSWFIVTGSRFNSSLEHSFD